MSYQDHVQATSYRPSCFGRAGNFDPSDSTCMECKWADECMDRCERDGEQPYRVPVSNYNGSRYRNYSQNTYKPNYTRPNAPEPEEGVKNTGLVREGERPVDRFVKDAATGALRGMFYEMYQFWKNFRFK